MNKRDQNNEEVLIPVINNIVLRIGDLFSMDADVVVIPKSTTGTISLPFIQGLKYKYGFEISKQLDYQHLGELLVVHHDLIDIKGKEKIVYLVFVTCVDNNTSELRFITRIIKSLVDFINSNLKFKNIAMPLIGTGAGGLTSYDVFSEIKAGFVLKSNSDCTLHVFTSESAYDQIQSRMEEKSSQRNGQRLMTDEMAFNATQVVSKYLELLTIYIMDSDFIKEQANVHFKESDIWRLGYEESFFTEVKRGDVIVLKNWLVQHNEHSINVEAVGVVHQKDSRSKTFDIKWLVSSLDVNLLFDDELRRAAFVKLTTHDAVDLFRCLPDWLDILGEVSREVAYGSNNLTNAATKIATLQNDTHVGEDYLGLKPDITAFSKIIASSAFTPPLSIALFGKWGTGKSFFMSKLQSAICQLSKTGDRAIYRRGIAQIHFNAWSYMDANLWASIVSKIFEGLNQYIKNDTSSEEKKREIKYKLNQNLVVTSEKLLQIEQQKEEAEKNLKNLEKNKNKVAARLAKKIEQIKSGTFTETLKAVNEKFNVEEELKPIITNDPIVHEAVGELKKIIPVQYWDNPDMLYKESKSAYTFLVYFFRKDRIWGNLICLGLILLITWLMPVFILKLKPWVREYVLPTVQMLLYGGTLLVPIWIRGKAVWDKLSPTISKFWLIREDYLNQIEMAKIGAAQLEKALELEVSIEQQKLTEFSEQIQATRNMIVDLTHKSDYAVATEALYSFIEKRCSSEDYNKHLGIVSVIRRDFEVLSGLFIDHQKELTENIEDVDAFRKLFDNPLERIVLYIDDLDRCPEDRVVEVLEAVNLLMAFPLFVVIVGVDPRWVKQALKRRHGLKAGEVSASDYLEKIFQVPFHLKKADNRNVRDMMRSLIMPRVDGEGGVFLQEPELTEERIVAPKSLEDFITSEIKGARLQNVINGIQQESEEEMSVEHLELSEKECELMLQMSEVIGNNPRAIKRYVNIYHIVRAHEGFIYREGKESHEFHVVMFLLAMYTGRFRQLVSPMMKFFVDLGNDSITLGGFLERPLIKQKGAEQLRIELSGILIGRSIYNKLLSEQLVTFKHHNEFLSRFTFENEYE